MRKQHGIMVVALVLAGCGMKPATGLAILSDHGAAGKAVTAKRTPRAAATETTVELAGPARTQRTEQAVNRASANLAITVADAAPAVSAPRAAATSWTHVSAATGGVVRSADGRASVTIPPGALISDAGARLVPLATSDRPLTAYSIPGVAFRLDLGGARIAPGHALKITAPADPRLVEEARRRDAGFDPAALGLSQGPDGGWLLTMPVNGPATMPVVAPLVAKGGGIGFTEWGALPLPPGPAPARTLLAASESVGAAVSTAEDCVTFEQLVGFAVPGSADEVRRREGEGAFVCDAVHKTEWFTRVMDDLWKDRTPCRAGGGQPPPGAEPVSPVPVAVPAEVVWRSDDPALDGAPAIGARVRYDLPWTPANGPADVVADAAGRTTSFTLAGLRVGLTPWVEGPQARSGETSEALAAAGMAPVRLAIANFSPAIVLEVEGDDALESALTVSYTLDGRAAEVELPVPPGTKGFEARFHVRVPSDGDHRFELTGVRDGAWRQGSAPGTRRVRRNGTYRFAVRLAAPLPK